MAPERIVIVDYDMGNLASVRSALRAVGGDPVISADPARVAAADGIVLPGVGSFRSGMRKLIERGLADAIRRAAARGRPVLGICLGMQLLFEEGEESGAGPGLGLIRGRVTLLPDSEKLPQIGWNLVELCRPDHFLFAGIPNPCWAYFDHSYAAEGADPGDVLATTEYGRRFPSVVGRRNLVGIQFHPEKSSRVGLQMLASFRRFVCDSRSTRP